MKDLLIDKTNSKIIVLAEEFINQSQKSIFWIHGKSGYGKTAIVDYLVDRFMEKNKKVCPLTSEDIVNLIVNAARNQYSNKWILSHFEGYDLLVFDNIDILLNNKYFTQTSIKELLQKISEGGKIKIILTTGTNLNKLRNLRFNIDEIYRVNLKKPTIDFKTKLLKKYLERNKMNAPKGILYNIAKGTDNLFQLNGLFHQLQFIKK